MNTSTFWNLRGYFDDLDDNYFTIKNIQLTLILLAHCGRFRHFIYYYTFWGCALCHFSDSLDSFMALWFVFNMFVVSSSSPFARRKHANKCAPFEWPFYITFYIVVIVLYTWIFCFFFRGVWGCRVAKAFDIFEVSPLQVLWTHFPWKQTGGFIHFKHTSPTWFIFHPPKIKVNIKNAGNHIEKSLPPKCLKSDGNSQWTSSPRNQDPTVLDQLSF